MYETVMKYLVHSMVIVGIAYALGKGRRDWQNLMIMAIGSAVSFMILDLFSPVVADSARRGAGYGMGFNMVGGAPDANKALCDSYREFENLKNSVERLEEIYNSDDIADIIDQCPQGQQQGQQEEEGEQKNQEGDDDQQAEDILDELEDEDEEGWVAPQAGGGYISAQYASY